MGVLKSTNGKKVLLKVIGRFKRAKLKVKMKSKVIFIKIYQKINIT